MSRTTRALLCALCLTTFGLAAAPAFAQPGPVPGAVPEIILTKILRGIPVTVVGGGATEEDAEANAIAKLEEDYIVLSYEVVNSFCTEIQLPTPDPYDTEPTVTLCAVEIEARVVRKITPITPFLLP